MGKDKKGKNKPIHKSKGTSEKPKPKATSHSHQSKAHLQQVAI